MREWWLRFRRIEWLALVLGLLLAGFVVWAFFFNGPPHERAVRGSAAILLPVEHHAGDFAKIAAVFPYRH